MSKRDREQAGMNSPTSSSGTSEKQETMSIKTNSTKDGVSASSASIPNPNVATAVNNLFGFLKTDPTTMRLNKELNSKSGNNQQS